MTNQPELKNVIVDLIRNTENDEQVKEYEGNKRYCGGDGYITLTKQENPSIKNQELMGYKLYRHEIPKSSPERAYNFSNIHYNGNKHVEFSGLEIFTTVSVLYLFHDKNNIAPLFVELSTKYMGLDIHSTDYYKYENSNKWAKEYITHNFQVPFMLSQILESTGYPVNINLDTQTEYCINGESTVNNIDYRISKIAVYHSKIIDSYYNCYKHYIQGSGDMMVLSTYEKNVELLFEGHDSRKLYAHVNVYYWTLDLKTALFIQLGEGDEIFLLEKDLWKKNSSINHINLSNTLEKQNCLRNRAHVINISIRGIHYYCCVCSEEILSEDKSTNYKYSKYTHTSNNGRFSISRFEDGTTEQNGLPSAKDVSQVCVYYYVRSPFSIRITLKDSVNRWFIKTGKDEWNESHEDLKSEHETVSKILGTMLYNSVDNSKSEMSYTECPNSESQGNFEFVEYLTSSANGPYSIRASGTSILHEFPHTGAQISGTRANSGSTNRVAIVVGGVSGSIIALLGGLETLAFFKYPNKSVIRSLVGMFNKSLDYKPLEQLNGLIFLGTQNLGTSVTHFYQNTPKNVV